MTHHDHAHGLTAGRSEVVKFTGWFVCGRGPVLIRTDDVAALHVVAGETDNSSGGIGLYLNDANMAFIGVHSAHSLHQFVLPLEPLDVGGFCDGPDDGKAVAN